MDSIEQICNHIKDILNQYEVKYSFNSEYSSFSATFLPAKSAISFCNTNIYVRQDYIYAYAIFPFRADEKKYTQVAQFINDTNSKLKCGNFEIDYHDGEIRCKVNFEYTDPLIPNNILKNLISFPSKALNIYSKQLMDIIFKEEKDNFTQEREENIQLDSEINSSQEVETIPAVITADASGTDED
ncbi:MAG: hypothetical protein IJ566_04010 [Cardiobacteriaceae bacterium]|nr:hypothetical protein [Cardiobacteriaceae bacterium]